MPDIQSAELSRTEYSNRKNEIVSLLDSAIEFYGKEDEHDNLTAFSKLKDDLMNGEFSIVVVGEFSAGKSTLLNAMMRERILPSFTNETTATVNFLRHKDKSKHGELGTVYYNDGKTVDLNALSLDTINKYVSTKGDEVAKKVDHLDLYLDSDFLKDGVTLVDSPGLNGVADGHREITEQQILKSHASIFLFNSDHPGTKTDFEFLHELQKKVKTIIFVLNKIDGIKADEGETVESVTATLKDNYKKLFPDEQTVPEIWPVAAYPALVARNSEPLEYHDIVDRTEEEKAGLEKVSRLEAFEDRLLRFLTCGEKAQQQLLAPVNHVISIAKESKEQYENEKNVLSSAVDASDLEDQIAKIKDAVTGLNKQIGDSKSSITSSINKALSEVVEELSSEISKFAGRKLSEIDDFDDVDELNDYIRSFEKNFVSKVSHLADDGEESLQEKIRNIIRMEYTNNSDLLEQKISESKSAINLNVINHLDVEEHFFEVGLKEMDENTKMLKEELKTLMSEADDAEKDFMKARRNKKRRNEIEAEIKNLNANIDILKEQMLPLVQRYTEEVRNKESRGGILGTAADFIFGKKKVTSHEMREDSREYDDAKEIRDRAIADKQCKIDRQSTLLEQYEDVDIDSLEIRQNRKMAEVEQARLRLNRQEQENTQKIMDKYNKEIMRNKRILREFCDDVSDELIRQVKKQLSSSEENYVDTIVGIVEANVRADIKDKEQRMEKLKKQMQSSEQDKKSKIEALNNKLKKVNDLLSNAADLFTELENMEVDKISTTAL